MGKKMGYLHRLIVSYGIAIFIPIVLLCLLVYRVGIVKVHQRMVTNQLLLLAQAAETLNTRLRECSEISTLISMDQSLLELSERLEPWEIREGVQILSGYTKANSFFSDIVIWRMHERMVFTAKGTEWIDVMLKKHGFSQTEKEMFEQMIGDGKAHLVHFESAQVLMSIVPIPLLAKNFSGCAMYLFDGASFNGLFASGRQDEYGMIALIDENQSPIYIHGTDAASPLDGELLHMAADALEKGSLHWGGNKYTVVSAPVEIGGWRFISLMPEKWMTSGMYVAELILWISIIVFIALLTASFFVRRQYIPIRELAQKAGEKTGGNEIQEIGSALDMIAVLREQADQHRSLLHGAVLEGMLHGSIRNTQEIERALTSMDMFGGKETLCVYAAKLREQQPEARQMLLRWISEGFITTNTAASPYGKPLYAPMEGMPRPEAYALTEKAGDNHVLFVIRGFQGEEKEGWRAYAGELAAAAETIGGANIGVGHPCNLHDTSASYLQASIALEAASEQASPVFFNDMKGMPRIDDAFRQKLTLLLYSLTSGRTQSFAELMEELLDMLEHHYQSKILWRYYAFQLAEGIVKFLSQEAGGAFLRNPMFVELTRDLTMALSMHALDAYLEKMRLIAERIVEMMGSNAKQEGGAQGYVMSWIEENITDPLMSLNMLSDTFGFSQAYWSRYVKEQTGKHFNDLVWSMRCDIVKERLLHTELPIKQIVQEAGYIDVSSFTRRFKQSEHLTPGQYRISCLRNQ